MEDKNYLYVNYKQVAAELSSEIKHKQFTDDDIYAWCAEAINIYIADIEFMWKYLEMGFEIVDQRVLVPCNTFRIIDVFDASERNLDFFNTGTYLYDIKLNNDNLDDGEIVYLNYYGSPVNEAGDLLIAKDFVPACNFFCKTKIYFEDYIEGKIPMQMYWDLQRRFDNSADAGRNTYRSKTREWINNQKVIRGNMLAAIGGIPLIHNL